MITNRKPFTLTLAVGLAVLAACRAAPPGPAAMSAADVQAIRDEIGARTLEINALGATNDLEQYRSVFATNADALFRGDLAVFVHGTRVLPTTQAVWEAFEPMKTTRRGTNFDLVESHVAVLSPTMALQVATQRFSVVDTMGVESPMYPMSSTTLWVKEGDQWKIAHHHQSWSNTPVQMEGT